ncbi:MAG: hypothetical protein IPH66_18065 [Crocinitomicaceae bacterium]|nr:hypothetical protein [Crocinitomicaceae bacterium]MBK7131238.1 hypothetical protein [Crocinitomicaceae bacterium]
MVQTIMHQSKLSYVYTAPIKDDGYQTHPVYQFKSKGHLLMIVKRKFITWKF